MTYQISYITTTKWADTLPRINSALVSSLPSIAGALGKILPTV